MKIKSLERIVELWNSLSWGKLSMDLDGPQAAVVLVGLLGMACGLFAILRCFECSRDKFSELLEVDDYDESNSDAIDAKDWTIEYTNPLLLGVPQFGVRFQSFSTPEGLYLKKDRSLTGGTRKGVVFLPVSRYSTSRHLGRLNVASHSRQLPRPAS